MTLSTGREPLSPLTREAIEAMVRRKLEADFPASQVIQKRGRLPRKLKKADKKANIMRLRMTVQLPPLEYLTLTYGFTDTASVPAPTESPAATAGSDPPRPA